MFPLNRLQCLDQMHFAFPATMEKWRETNLHFTCLRCSEMRLRFPYSLIRLSHAIPFPFWDADSLVKGLRAVQKPKPGNKEQGAANKGNNSKANKSG